MCIAGEKFCDLSIQNVFCLREDYDNKFSKSERRKLSFCVILEFIIRIGNAKSFVSAIYMLISTFGSSFALNWITR